MLSNLNRQLLTVIVNLNRIEQLWELFRLKLNVQNGSDNLNNRSDILF